MDGLIFLGPLVFNIILGLFCMTIHGKRKRISSQLDESDSFSKNPDLPVACTPATGPCSAIFYRIIVPGANTKHLVYSNRWFARNHVAVIFRALFSHCATVGWMTDPNIVLIHLSEIRPKKVHKYHLSGHNSRLGCQISDVLDSLEKSCDYLTNGGLDYGSGQSFNTFK